MREIKFRLWDTQKNKWYKNSDCVIELDGSITQIDVVGEYDGEEKHDFKSRNDLVVMQYTGLKDKNGKGIYEGDIVKGKNYGFNNPIRYIGTVEYVYNKFKVIGCRNKYKGTNDELSTIYEVIGNVYENPELLDGESQ